MNTNQNVPANLISTLSKKTQHGVELWLGEEPDSQEEIDRTLRDAIILLANDDEDLLGQTEYDLKGNYLKAATFLKEAIEKGQYRYAPDFDPSSFAIEAENTYNQNKEKYSQKLFTYSINKKEKKVSGEFLEDTNKIKSAFASCKNAEDVTRQYETLLNNVLDGKIKLKGAERKEFLAVNRGPQGVEHVSRYLNNLLQRPEFKELDKSGLTPEFIKKTCTDALDSARTRAEYVNLFKNQLGMQEFDKSLSATYFVLRNDGKSPDTFRYYDNDIPTELLSMCDGNCLAANGIVDHLKNNADVRNRVIGDPIATYASFEKYHNDHSFFYRVFHPVNYYNEYKSLGQMKNVFTKFLKIPEKEFNDLKNERKDHSFNPIDKAYRAAKDFDKERSFKEAYKKRHNEVKEIRTMLEANQKKIGYASKYTTRDDLLKNLSDEDYKKYVAYCRKQATSNVKEKQVIEYRDKIIIEGGPDAKRIGKMNLKQAEEVYKAHLADLEEKNLNEIREAYKNSLLDDVKPTENEEIGFTSKLGEKTAGYEKDAPTGNVNLINGNEKDLTEEKVAE